MKTKITHYRYINADGPGGTMRVLMPTWLLRQLGFGRFIESRGGFTHVELEMDNGIRSGAWARCSPTDNYIKAAGRQIALGRAINIAQGAVAPDGHPLFWLAFQSLSDSIRCSPEWELGRGAAVSYIRDDEAGVEGISIPIGGR